MSFFRLSETFKLWVTKFDDVTLVVTMSFLFIVTVSFVVYWIYNKKKYHQLGHQIPASVVKNYLDSIIQNSTSLKSSLFRGGGLDVDGAGIPSVLPLSGLGGDQVSAGGGGNPEELAQKNAQINQLNAQLTEKLSLIAQLEAKIAELEKGLAAAAASGGGDSAEVPGLKARVTDLEAQLAKALEDLANAPAAGDGGGGDEALKSELTATAKERDDLKERLQEYEIIEDDLANLKRLQQENEQLKKSLADGGGAPPPAAEPAPEPEPAAAAPAVEPEPEPEPEAPPAEAPPELETKAEAEDAPAPEDVPDLSSDDSKSAEDLLNEFEKMLGS
ncbi:MAG: hypothetical protein HOE90_16565 [Bacteriovoracaceae bacterium]|nr:hypothetical protein [Bacteriovoracaceae bacterium]